MELREFIKSHDEVVLAVANLKNLFEDEGFTGALEYLTDIENHLELLETEYLNGMQYLATGGE